MSNSEEGAKAFALTTVAGSGTVLASTLAERFIPGSGPVLPVLAVLFNSTLTLAIRGYFDRRAEPFSQGYASEFSSAEAAREHGEQHKNSEAYQTTMYQSFRAMMDAVDPSVVPTLGRLTAQYNRAEAMPDMYFRALSRLLIDLEEGELTDLVNMLRRIPRLTEPNADAQGFLEISVGEPTGDEINTIFFQWDRGVEDSMRVKSAMKLIRLMRRVGLTREGPAPWSNGGSLIKPIDSVQVRQIDVIRILKTIDPQP